MYDHKKPDCMHLTRLLRPFLLLFPFAAAAQNLVPNGRFNAVNTCENASPCAPKAWYTSYDIDWTYQRYRHYGREGSLCIFMVTGEKERSYWQCELLDSLVAGTAYDLAWYVKNADGKTDASVIRIAFASARRHLLGMKRSDSLQPAAVQIRRVKRLADNWMKIEAVYVAKGGETWMLAGAFGDIPPAAAVRPLYAVDDLSLLPARGQQMTEVQAGEKQKQRYAHTLRHDFTVARPRVMAPEKNEPVNMVAKPMVIKDTIRLTDVLFDVDSYRLNAQADTFLARHLVDRLKTAAYATIVVNGHTDNSGTDVSNSRLSLQRAQEVAAYLQRHGVPADRIVVNGFGSRAPLYSNDTPDNRRLNRRVDIVVLWQ